MDIWKKSNSRFALNSRRIFPGKLRHRIRIVRPADGSWEVGGSGTNSVIEFLAARNPITRQIPIEFCSGEEKNRGSIYA